MSRVSRRQLAEAVLQMLQAHPAGEVSRSLAAYLIAERRTKEVDLLMRDIESLRRREGILEITAISAHGLDDEAKQQITSLFPANKVVLQEQIDPQLIGGVKIRTSDQQLDLSIKSKLKKLKYVTPKSA